MKTFTIASKRIKYLRINLAEEMQNLYSGNYKILLKKIKEDLNKMKDIPFSWIGTLLRWQTSPNWSTGSTQSLSESLRASL